MDLRIGLITVGILWVLGALVTTTFLLVFGRSMDKRDGMSDRNPFITVAGSLILMLFIWPFAIGGLWEWLGPRLGVKLRLKPSWVIKTGDERTSKNWRLKDGTELKASAWQLSPVERLEIEVKSDHHRVDYRLRMIAPRQQPATNWSSMERRAKIKLSEEEEEDFEDSEDADSLEPFLSSPQLEPGKYQVEFRVKLSSGEFEELSGVTLIVT